MFVFASRPPFVHPSSVSAPKRTKQAVGDAAANWTRLLIGIISSISMLSQKMNKQADQLEEINIKLQCTENLLQSNICTKPSEGQCLVFEPAIDELQLNSTIKELKEEKKVG